MVSFSCFIATYYCETEDKCRADVFEMKKKYSTFPMNVCTCCFMWSQFFQALCTIPVCPLCVSGQEFCYPYSLFSGCEYFCSRGRETLCLPRPCLHGLFSGPYIFKEVSANATQLSHRTRPPTRPFSFTCAVFMIKALICLSGVEKWLSGWNISRMTEI